MPGAIPHPSTVALTDATALHRCDRRSGPAGYLRPKAALTLSVNTSTGLLVYRPVAGAHNPAWVPIDDA